MQPYGQDRTYANDYAINQSKHGRMRSKTEEENLIRRKQDVLVKAGDYTDTDTCFQI